MIVYELRHTVNAWAAPDTHVYIMIFAIKKDAITYLTEKKHDIIERYCKHLRVPNDINKLKSYMASEFDCDCKDELDYFNIWADKFGDDTLEIIEKQVFKFE